MRRKIILFLFILFISSNLFAADYSADIAIGHRNSSVADSPVFISSEVRTGPFSFYLQTDMGQMFDFAANYEIRQGATLSHNINTSLQLVPHEGGFSTYSYLFKQKLDWSWGFFRYGIGAQAGLAWSPYTDTLSWSLSPMGEITLGLQAGDFKAETGLTTYDSQERSWKATPVITALVSYDISSSLTVYASAYAEIAELFMQPYILISSYGGKIGIIARGTDS